MDIFKNIDLLFVSVASLGIGVLGFLVYFNNRKSVTHRVFLVLSVFIIIWSFINYFSYQFNSHIKTLWFLRFALFFATLYAFYIFKFLYVFPYEKIEFSHIYKNILVPLIFLVSFSTLTPFVFIKVLEISPRGGASRVQNGIGIILFGIMVVSLLIVSFFILMKKLRLATNFKKQQLKFLFIGAISTFSLHIIFNFIFPAFLDNTRFIPFGGVFAFPFIGFTAYAILKHKLFNLKIIAAEFLTFAIWLALFARIFMSDNSTDRAVGAIIFIATFIFGIMLIKSVSKEVRIKEEMEKLYADLKIADEKLKMLNEEKSEFLFMTSHQIRTPMTVIKGYISMIMEGDFGKVSAKLKDVLNKIYISNERLVKIINDLLDLSRIERGKMEYDFKNYSLKKITLEAISELESYSKEKGLNIVFEKNEKELPDVRIDEEYTRQVIINLLDNAIKYSTKGRITIKIEEKKDKIILSVKDEGKGISKETIPGLFQRYSREEKSYSKAARGMGLGLYIAKKIIEDQNGRIWAESEGEGKGSIFFVELPAVKN